MANKVIVADKNDTGLGLASVLLIIFVVLKLTNNIDWSWWWVLSPIWITLVLFMLFIVIMVFVLSIQGLFK